MKIGILTLPLHTNYGGILQAYALQTVLERMGHSVEIFNTQPSFAKPIYWKYPLRLLKKLFVNNDIVVTREARTKKEYPIVSTELLRFQKDYIHSRSISSLFDIKKNEYDAIIVGSDQIWRPMYFKRMWRTDISNAFLSFSDGWNIKRIAYAPSFGVDEWEFTEKETELCKSFIKQFDTISVREISGINLCNKHLCIEATHVLDPTMLLTVDDYIALLKDKCNHHNTGKMLCYILDNNTEKRDLISKISEERHLSPFSVNCSDVKNTAPITERIKPSVEEWLQGFYDADFVVTDSFHACVFSIIFNKPFIVIGNIKRGLSRFSSLMKTFGLEQCLITSINEYSTEKMDFNWKKVNEVLESRRKESFHFLQHGITK